jgi:hypothetical protein
MEFLSDKLLEVRLFRLLEAAYNKGREKVDQNRRPETR